MQEPIFVTKPLLPKKETFFTYVEKIWENRWLTNQGELHQLFEQKLSEYLTGLNVTLTVNGHIALETAIRGMQLEGEVITTPFSFASTAHAISLTGCKPVFCDIKAEDLTLDEEKIEDLVTDKTTAILPVHVYGHPCNVDKIAQIAQKHNLKIIYDAAHAFGVCKDGQSIAAYGDISIFSFHATKLFNSIEGGAMVYSDNNLRHRLDLLKNFGIKNEDCVELIAGNGKMNEFQAAMGLCNLELMPDVLAKRKGLVLQYRQELQSVKGLRYFIPEDHQGITYNYSYFVILINEAEFGMNRDTLYKKLKDKKIFARKYFYPLIPDYTCYKENYRECAFPVAAEVSQQVLTLPLYYDLQPQQITQITDSIKQIQWENLR